MEASQFLERFRLLSREIQISLQITEKKIDSAKLNPTLESIESINDQIKIVNENWSDFSGWVLISTLENVDEARRNSVSGLIDIKSKIIRSKKRAISQADQHGVKIDIKNAEECQVNTYIAYFEQFLDLIFLNAVKYSPRGYSVDVSSKWKNGTVNLLIESIAPLILKHEMNSLGNKGFRAENAIKTNKPGDGFGLSNVLKLAQLLDCDVNFTSTNRSLFEVNGIPYSDFSVSISLNSNN